MNRSTLLLAMGFTAALAACSGGEPSQPQAPTQEKTQTQAQPPSQTPMPANPHANVQGMVQQSAQESAQQPAPASSADRNQLPKNGKVVKAMHAAGYTYMQIEKDGREFWIASTMLNVKKNDHVRWADAAVMKNFTSSTLHRTFDEILFVTNAELDQ
jgi:hypothetical protein